MAVNKDSNGYTFLFAIILVVVVGAGLASVSLGLKPRQDKNVEVKKKMDILGAIKIEADRKNGTELYDKYILQDESIVINDKGEKIGDDPFSLDIKKQYRELNAGKVSQEEMQYPLYAADVDNSKKYIIPMVGKGLWGPIWGYVAVNEDKSSIYGAKFFHQGETPGLGAEISNYARFQKQFETEVISTDGEYKQIKVVKDGSGNADLHKVDGITGGTITSKGVESMLDETLQVYVNYFTK